MARPIRIEFPGAVYHVTSRGDRREAIYLTPSDRLIWLDILGLVCERYNWRCYAWCQMGNHYHIVVETVEANLSKGMRQLNGVYTQKYNRRHGQVGHVFQGRFNSILVDQDSYLLEVCRYVVLNPIRANLVKQAGQWPWSSYRSMMGEATVRQWLEIDVLLSAFSTQRVRALARYAEFVHAGVDQPAPWSDLTGANVLGSESFIESLEGVRELSHHSNTDLREVNRLERRALTKPLKWFANNVPDDKEAMALAFQTGAYTLREIADHFGVHYSTVSRVVRRFA